MSGFKTFFSPVKGSQMYFFLLSVIIKRRRWNTGGLRFSIVEKNEDIVSVNKSFYVNLSFDNQAWDSV